MRKPWFRAANLTWYVQLPGGRQVSLGKDERFDAPPKKKPRQPPKAVEDRWKALLRQGGEPEKLLFSDLVDKHREATLGYTEDTRKVTRVLLTGFMKHVGPIKAAKLRPHHLSDYLRTKPNWSPSYQRLCIAKIEAVVNHALAEGWIEENPLTKGQGKVKKPRAERRTAIVTPEEQERLEAAAVPQFRDFLVGLRESGCRPGELAGAQIEDCDLEAGILKVRNKTAKSTGIRSREVWLSPPLKELIQRLIGDRTEGPIWRNCFGGPWTTNSLIKRMFCLRTKLGLRKEVTLYGYRHRWASAAINNHNVSPALVARQLGHQDLTMLLKHYFHEDPEAMLKAVEQATRREP